MKAVLNRLDTLIWPRQTASDSDLLRQMVWHSDGTERGAESWPDDQGGAAGAASGSSPTSPSATRRRPERLAALRAGRPVTVNAGCLPRWARDGLGVPVTALTYLRVRADGGIELLDNGAQLFAEEHRM